MGCRDWGEPPIAPGFVSMEGGGPKVGLPGTVPESPGDAALAPVAAKSNAATAGKTKIIGFIRLTSCNSVGGGQPCAAKRVPSFSPEAGYSGSIGRMALG